MKPSAKLFFFSILWLMLSACNHKSSKNHDATSGTKIDSASVDSVKAKKSAILIDSTINTDSHNKLNDVALYLAGMKPDSFIAIPKKLQNLEFYKLFCDSMDKGFHHMETNRLSKMRDWAKTEMAPERASPKTVFYPFSGPDILHCLQFYPDGDQYIMIALEKYGSLPVMDKMDEKKTVSTLKSIEKSLEDIFGKSYFITHKMLHDVSNHWNGVTPLACIFLVRAGYSVLDIRFKHMMDDGKTFVNIPADSTGKDLNDCVEIYFRKNASSKIQKLIYFKTNLCDSVYGRMPGFMENTGLQAYLNNMPECYTYVKSASYLMSYKTFSVIRDICLRKSKSILQDDTGIAFQYIDKTKWNIKLYGHYVKPVSDFSGVFQEDLKRAYISDSSNVKPLDFSLGYHWGKKNTQNLMKFEKK